LFRLQKIRLPLGPFVSDRTDTKKLLRSSALDVIGVTVQRWQVHRDSINTARVTT
jgi:hypothetical protein